MQEKIIYEKKYPPIDYNKRYEHDKVEIPENPGGEKRSFDELMKGIYANTRYTPIPKREEESEEFIKKAIDVSDLYQMDIRIIRLDGHVSVFLSFDFGADMRYISRLFGMADRIAFFKDKSEHDIAVCLDFYTHVVVRSGLAVAP